MNTLEEATDSEKGRGRKKKRCEPISVEADRGDEARLPTLATAVAVAVLLLLLLFASFPSCCCCCCAIAAVAATAAAAAAAKAEVAAARSKARLPTPRERSSEEAAARQAALGAFGAALFRGAAALAVGVPSDCETALRRVALRSVARRRGRRAALLRRLFFSFAVLLGLLARTPSTTTRGSGVLQPRNHAATRIARNC